MADIGGIGGFNVAATRSGVDTEAASQRRAEERQRQEELQEARRQEAEAEELRRTEETSTDQEDSIVLSNAAQDFLVQADQEGAANDDAQATAVAATQEADAVARTTQIGGVTGTNQDTADEENTTTVNGNRDEESEQTRALGQIVDQFA